MSSRGSHSQLLRSLPDVIGGCPDQKKQVETSVRDEVYRLVKGRAGVRGRPAYRPLCVM